MLHQISYDFYEKYLDDKVFSNILKKRIKYLKSKHQINCSDDDLIKEYFVEVFCWTVLDYELLIDINTIIEKYVPNGILIDPCSGNSFHTFIFNQFTNREVITIDIQPEENAWIETIEADGLEFLEKMENHSNKILLLSWIDFTKNELPYNLLKSFKGNLVVSIGNYMSIDCKMYIDELNNKYKLVKSYECIMPWNLNEEIKIFKLIEN